MMVPDGISGKMQLVRSIVPLLYLTLNSFLDLRIRRISMLSLSVCASIGGIFFFLEAFAAAGSVIWTEVLPRLLFSLLPGMFLLLLSLVTRGGIGMGDALSVLLLGLFYSPETLLSALVLSALGAAFTGGILLAVKKIRLKDGIPFLPFLLLGTLVSVFFPAF